MKVIDMHCDTISELYKRRQQEEAASLRRNELHVDLEKLERGGYGLQNFALYVNLHKSGDPYHYARELMQFFHEEMERCREAVRMVRTWREIEENWHQGVLSALLTIEEGGVCQGDLGKLQAFYDGGVRMMTLTWNFENELGYPNRRAESGDGERRGPVWLPDTEHGLKEMGIAFVEQMEALGMIIDISHLNDAGIWDVFCHTRKPFVASHSNARSVAGHPRNLTDEMLKALAERGGVAGINFYAPFLRVHGDGPAPDHSSLADMVRHMEHMKQIGGIGCIGLGSDFDGIDCGVEMENASGMQLLADEMHRKNFTGSEIEAVFSGNVLRVYKDVLSR